MCRSPPNVLKETMTTRTYSPIDRILGRFSDALQTTFATARPATRSNPAATIEEQDLSTQERELAGRLMRINHSGEVSAQALYQGQAISARLPRVREKMTQAALEEVDHLAWTEERIMQLGGHKSVLNPCWYIGSFTIGAVAGLAGDRWSLGFVAETERQVVRHLDRHLKRLPPQDRKSRAILEQMRSDEQHHATVALQSGAAELPGLVKSMMRLMSRVMTTTVYWI